MKTIDKIKDNLESAKDFDGTRWRYLSVAVEDLKALVEYFEVAEAWRRDKFNRETWARMNQARSGLEDDTP
ncbi:MAG: hypothetical protein U1E51_20355 [Candidatus Binatia bacterium]|nr:hypothetical protein [Candidatus Binatia bacterium]